MNHPVHLYWNLREEVLVALGPGPVWTVFRDNLLREEGLLDLTTAAIEDRTSGATQTESSLAPQSQHTASLASSGDPATGDQNPLRTLMIRNNLHRLAENVAAFSEPQKAKILPLSDVWCRNFIVLMLPVLVYMLGQSEAQASTVELIWSVMDTFDSPQRRPQTPLIRVHMSRFGKEVGRDYLILMFQFLCGQDEEARHSDDSMKLAANHMAEAVKAGIPFMKAASYLPRQHVLRSIDRLLEAHQLQEEKMQEKPDLRYLKFRESAVALADMLKSRQLEDIAVLKLLQCVKGDARKVWALDGLTLTTKELVHVPFKGVHDGLKAKNQS